MTGQIEVEIEEFVKNLPMDFEFSTKWFKTELSKKYNRPEDSYIPSDYCYNLTNNGINYEKQPHYFMRNSRGKYRYVGKNYIFKGVPEHNPKSKNHFKLETSNMWLLDLTQITTSITEKWS